MRARRDGIRSTRPRFVHAAATAVVVGAALVLAVGGGVAAATPRAAAAALPPQSRFVEVPESPGGSARIRIDTDLYLPATRPAPAVLLAHGFGQDKHDLAAEAKRLQGEGYVVLAYSARGFGASGGRIGLDSLDGEVADARALVDVIARRPEVLKRGGDPVVGVVGASYGGALALMLGATDPRIDTVVAGITWNDLAQALDPVSAGREAGPPGRADDRAAGRLFKAGWAAQLFGTGATDETDPCSRFTAQLCSLYRTLVTGGRMTPADFALVRRSSPSSVLGSMTAPTLLLQGLQDSLFGLDQADANQRQIRAAGAVARVQWFDGGHDGDGVAGTETAVDRWLDARLKHHSWPLRRFEYDVPASATSFPEHHVTSRYPGLDGNGTPAYLRLEGTGQTVVNPPGGQPASVTSLPGIGPDTAVGRAAGGVLAARNPPAQAARFVSAPLSGPMVLAGVARIRMHVTPVSGGDGSVVLFGQLTARTGSGSRVLPGGVAPIRVRLPPGGTTIDVALPATVWRFAPGDRVELTLRTTDSQYLGSTTPAAFRLTMVGGMRVPEIATRTTAGAVATPSRTVLWRIGTLLAVALLLLVGAVIAGRLRSGAARRTEERAGGLDAGVGGPAAAPLRVVGVTKRFRSGFVAVDDVSFAVERGQVVGLLGENGAGKTTTMRMVLGLTRPDAGRIEAFGVAVGPGSPVLRRVGCFIEGPGFLPHLSGRRNLQLYWATTGRPRRDAGFDEVLAIADLGSAIRRRVRGYSQGMRQRLAIAQAMLGMPDLLVLDEPTNGLDPPQITALRDVLRRYAEGGRAVVVSSHLLGEVERTCSHVVVMSQGRVVAAGPVEEVAGAADELVLDVDDPAAAAAALEAAGVESAAPAGPDSIRVLPGALSTGAVIAALVRADVVVSDVRRGRHLEEAFLELIDATAPSA